MSSTSAAGPIIYTPVTHPVTQTSNAGSLRSQIKQLAQDVTAGNLTAAQQDYATLSQTGALANKNSTNPLVQDLQAVGKALQGGDIAGAQTAIASFKTAAVAQQQARLNGATSHNSHHEGGGHHVGGGDSGGQQTDPLAQAFTTLEQALQSNNLAGARSAFATIQADLQQAGFSFGSSSAGGGSSSSGGGSTSATASAAAVGSLNVTA